MWFSSRDFEITIRPHAEVMGFLGGAEESHQRQTSDLGGGRHPWQKFSKLWLSVDIYELN